MVNRGEEKVRVHMNVVPRSTMNTNGGTENYCTLKSQFSVPPLILEWLGFPPVLTQTLQVLASSCLPQQIFNFSSNLLTRFE